jgi:hypothetical protein
MKNLIKKLEKAQIELQKNTIKLKDRSYRRSKGYFGTETPDFTGLFVYKTFLKTPFLNTYLCLTKEDTAMWVDVDILNKKLYEAKRKQFAKQSIIDCEILAKTQIENGTINTNYYKEFIVGSKNIYFASPIYMHEDYNKSVVMPNTPKHRKVAEKLNLLMRTNKK